MQNQVKSYQRRVQVLSILAKHGPLSLRGIQSLIAPPIADRRLQDSLKRLSRSGIVCIRHQKIFRGTGVFYQIGQNDESRERAALILNCSSEELKQTQFRYRELLHSEACAIWAHRFSVLFPDAKVIREFNFRNNQIAQKAISNMRDDHELRPDMLLIFNENDPRKYMVIGIEVEKSLKSKERLERKLFKLVSRTYLDGIIYVCDTSQILEALKIIYSSKIISKAVRVKHYGENFLLLSDGKQSNKGEDMKMYNSKFKEVSLRDWIQKLSTTDVRLRNDHMFELSAVRC